MQSLRCNVHSDQRKTAILPGLEPNSVGRLRALQDGSTDRRSSQRRTTALSQTAHEGAGTPEFVARVQRAECSQYVWDLLPMDGGGQGSILRLDHLFPLGADPANWRPTNFGMTEDGLQILHEWVSWHITGERRDTSHMRRSSYSSWLSIALAQASAARASTAPTAPDDLG